MCFIRFSKQKSLHFFKRKGLNIFKTDDKWNCDLDKVKIRGEVVSSQILGKKISRVPPTGVEPMTFQKYRLERCNH